MSVLVLGGRGFIGRHVVAALTAARQDVKVGSRRGTPSCPEPIRLEKLLSSTDWLPLIEGVTVLVNCVGILRPRFRESYDAVHHLAPAALAAACAERGVRLIHVSALGLNPAARSGFITSKLAGEKALSASTAEVVIVRPSLLDGEGGFGAHWLRRVAQWPVHFVPASATGGFAPIVVSELADVICKLALSPIVSERLVEVGGERIMDMRAYLAALRGKEKRPALVIRVPSWLAVLTAVVCDLLHATPFSYGHYELLKTANLPSQAAKAQPLVIALSE